MPMLTMGRGASVGDKRRGHNLGFRRCQRNDCSPLGSMANYKWHSVALLGNRRDDEPAGDGWGEERRIVFRGSKIGRPLILLPTGK